MKFSRAATILANSAEGCEEVSSAYLLAILANPAQICAGLLIRFGPEGQTMTGSDRKYIEQYPQTCTRNLGDLCCLADEYASRYGQCHRRSPRHLFRGFLFCHRPRLQLLLSGLPLPRNPRGHRE